MKINYSLVLLVLIVFLTIGSFLYFHQTCAKLNEKQERLCEKQRTNLQPNHFAALMHSSDGFQTLIKQQTQLMQDMAELQLQLDTLSQQRDTLRPLSANPRIPMEEDIEINFQKQEDVMLDRMKKKRR